MNKEQYEKDLRQRREEHLKNIVCQRRVVDWQPCMHDACSECIGTGIRKDGTRCVHMISCPCPECRIWTG